MHVPQDIIEFSLRWRRKGQQYKYDKLEDYFDGFFTAFVLYNFLYELICDYDPSHFPQTGDRQRATEVAIRFLGSEAIASNQRIRTHTLEIKDAVESRNFYVRDTVWDNNRVKSLESRDAGQWAKNMLEIIYQIRCNTFHGSKSFAWEQRTILLPCIRILEAVNDMLIEKVDPSLALRRAIASRLPPGNSAVANRPPLVS